jgi:DNA polymerase III epsilon subunit-like protein
MTKKKQQELLKDGWTYLIFNDTETTGLGTNKEHQDRILQTGHALYLYKDGEMQFIEFLEENIALPEGVTIGERAAEVHGIWYPDLEGCPIFEESKSVKRYKELMEAGAYMVQHNGIAFDMPMLEKEGIFWPKDKVIDTMTLARHYNPTLEVYDLMKEKEIGARLQAMRYFYNFDAEEEFKEFMKSYKIKKIVAHTALADILVLAYFFKNVLVKGGCVTGLKQAAILSRKPVLTETIEWGNQIPKGSKYSDIIGDVYGNYNKPVVDYLDWGMNNMNGLDGSAKLSIATAIFNGVLDKSISAIRRFNFDTSMEEYIDFATAFNPEVYKVVVQRYKQTPTKESPKERVQKGLDYANRVIEKAKQSDDPKDEKVVETMETLIENRRVLSLLEND